MLKVWRGKMIFAECTSCGSYGTALHLKVELRMAPEIEEAVERHTAHMMALRTHYKSAAGGIVRQIKNGSMSRKDGAAKIRALWENHVAQVRLGEAGLPDPTGKITEVVTTCPWCGVEEPEVEIETLPEGVIEPKFEQAVAVQEYIAKQMQERADAKLKQGA